MPNVFISYRRSDSQAATGRIADRLQNHFGKDNVFHDVDSIGLGRDFGDLIEERLDKTDVFLVVIGDDWLDAPAKDGSRRIDDPTDLVHMEIARALARGKDVPVVPVMVGSASSPPTDAELPPALEQLNNRNATVMRSDETFEGQIQRLIRDIEQHGGGEEVPKRGPEKDAEPRKSGVLGKIAIAIVATVALWFVIDAVLMEVEEPVYSDETEGSAQPFESAAQPNATESASGDLWMPEVRGLSLPDATMELNEMGVFDIQDSYNSETEVPVDRLFVKSSDPPAGDPIDTDSAIHLYLEVR